MLILRILFRLAMILPMFPASWPVQINHTVARPQVAINIDVNNLVPKVIQPDFDRDVLGPLRIIQAKELQEQKAEEAEKTALREAEQARLRAQQVIYIAPPPPVIYTAPSGDAKAFIYMHESGNNPKARNSTGCLGLGQACPGSKLLAVCPDLDYDCEDNYFTGYMLSRYGSWDNARYFWEQHRWW